MINPATVRGAIGVRDEEAWFVKRPGAENGSQSKIIYPTPEELRRIEIHAELQTGFSILRIGTIGSSNEKGTGITYITPQEPERTRTFTNVGALQPGLRYHWENSMAFLDKPGEWYFDATKQSGPILYYIPRPGEALRGPGAVTVVVPVLETIFRFEGSEHRRVHDVIIQGLNIGDTTWSLPSQEGFYSLAPGVHFRGNYPDWWWPQLHPAAIHLEGTDRVTLERNVLRPLGGAGINLHDFTHDTRVQGNSILEAAGIGVAIHGEGFTARTEETLVYPCAGQAHSVDDWVIGNRIQGIGLDYQGSAGIAASYPAGARIEHNVVADGPSTGIHAAGWYHGWTGQHLHSLHSSSDTSAPAPAPCEIATERNRVVGNDVSRVASVTDDVGAMYMLAHQSATGRYENGLQIRDNYVHHIHRPDTWARIAYPYATCYIDGDTNFATIANNIFEVPTGPGGRMIFANPDDVTSVPPHDFRLSNEGATLSVERLASEWFTEVGDNVSDPARNPRVRDNAGLPPEYRDIPSLDD